MSCTKHANTKQVDNRIQIINLLKQNYSGQYGVYKYYAGQVFVFKDKNKAKKTLRISDGPQDHESRPYLKFRARPVYAGDSNDDLLEVIHDWQEELNWYDNNFSSIPGLVLPKETFSICKDPLGSKNKTVMITTDWINNIQGDIFTLSSEKLSEYIISYPNFRETLILLIKKYLELADNDIYPDYLGDDNVAIFLKNKVPKITLIDRHLVFVGKHCNMEVKSRLDMATEKFQGFIKDPTNYNNIKLLGGKKTIFN